MSARSTSVSRECVALRRRLRFAQTASTIRDRQNESNELEPRLAWLRGLGGGEVMSALFRAAACCAVGSMLSACASLNHIHDPQFGVFSRQQVEPFLKSLRCELITFYDANRQKTKFFEDAVKIDRLFAIEHYPHFDLSDQLYGAVALDLKVVDTIGLPSTAGTSIDYKRTLDPNHSFTWHVGPSLNTQDTYDMTWNFLIEQDAKLSAAAGPPDPFQCYSAIPAARSGIRGTRSVPVLRDLDGLARGEYPEYERFTRILVNGTLPLAAWLQDNGAELSRTFVAARKESETERLIPAQLAFSFTVQVNAGLDARYTLVTTRWNPFSPDVSASAQHSSNLQFVLNGPNAIFFGQAKTGNVAITGEKPTPGRPPFVSEKLTPSGASGIKGSRGRLLYPIVPSSPPPQ